MKKYYPKEWLTIENDGKWNPSRIPRCQTPTVGARWMNLTDSTMIDWVKSSREHQKWATRLFTETLRRDPKINSFAIHLLIDAWPASWLKSIMDTNRKAKPAYFVYRNALRPVAVNLRPDAFFGFSGEKGKVAVFVCNDTPETFADAVIRYQIESNGKILHTGSSMASVPASNPKFQGWLEIPFPEVSKRDVITVRVGLHNADGMLIHDSDYDLEVFPVSDKSEVLERPGGYPQRLIK